MSHNFFSPKAQLPTPSKSSQMTPNYEDFDLETENLQARFSGDYQEELNSKVGTTHNLLLYEDDDTHSVSPRTKEKTHKIVRFVERPFAKDPRRLVVGPDTRLDDHAFITQFHGDKKLFYELVDISYIIRTRSTYVKREPQPLWSETEIAFLTQKKRLGVKFGDILLEGLGVFHPSRTETALVQKWRAICKKQAKKKENLIN